uniref:Reverse transcriptase domain-containing protein n=1 Tax=Sinocyclocheilus rhinocerous TaxID=307959 RepID=A0A673KKK9_9TELE
MYSKLKSRVKGTDGLTEYFGCTIGVRQGCMVSPLLFILFLNEYITMLKKNLQTLLYQLEKFCNLYGMRVNLRKTKIINTPMAERICSYCKLTSNIFVIEDEKHFLYEDLRKKYLGDLVLVGYVCIDVSSVCDSGYAWRLALYICDPGAQKQS